MIYDRIEPLTPIKEPTETRRGLSSMKPEIQSDADDIGWNKKPTFSYECEPSAEIEISPAYPQGHEELTSMRSKQ